MPGAAIVLWLVTGGLCFGLGTYFLWKIERSGVGRWGACGKVFGLGTSTKDDGRNIEDGEA